LIEALGAPTEPERYRAALARVRASFDILMGNAGDRDRDR
jgi:hypothetical protein